jgi:hypothetical protein
MKKTLFFLLLAFALTLTACAPLGAAAAAVEPSATPGIVHTNYPEALPVPSQLALGTISLKDSPNAVTPAQAATLVTLWKGLLALANTANSSTIEINALVAQIEETMTPAQLEAIAAMKLTQADFAKVMQTAGLNPGGGQTGGTGNRAGNTGGTGGNPNRQQGGGPAGEFGGPGGGFVGPGGFQGGGGNTTSQQGSASNATQATIAARQSRQALTGNTAMITVAITYLTQAAGK